MLKRKFFLSFIAATATATAVQTVWADDDEIPFEEAHIYFELNNTDGDLGIHALIDGDAWKRLEIEDPHERNLLNIRVNSRLRRQGLTELFFESAEPTFDELAPEVFFERFPEGIYEIEGYTLDGQELESETELTHALPAPAEPTVNGMLMAEVCDPKDPGYDAVAVAPPVTIEWLEVVESHPDLGVQPPVPVSIKNYEVEVEVLDAEFESKFNTILPPGETMITIPEELFTLGTEFKYEVIAREESDNQTAVESCFLLPE